MPIRFDTFDFPPSTQFDAWRDHYSPIFDLRLADGPAPKYLAEHTSWEFGGLTLTKASMPRNLLRHWRHWERPKIDDWIIVVTPSLANNPSLHSGRSLSFRSLTRPFENYGSDDEVVTLYLPREYFYRYATILDKIEPRLCSSGLFSLMADHIVTLEKQICRLSERELLRAAEVTRTMVRACIGSDEGDRARTRESIDSLLVKRARRIILKNIHVLGYSPSQLARDVGMSRSTLYRAFEPHGGVSAIIQQERLDAAHLRLAKMNRIGSINQVAYDLGFCDPSAFSRAFKAHFGYSPSMAIGLDPDDAETTGKPDIRSPDRFPTNPSFRSGTG